MLYICAGTLLNLLRYQFIRYGDIYSLHTADQKIKHIPFRRGVLAPRQRRLGRHPPAHSGRSRQRCCPRCSSLPALMLLAMGRPCNRPGRVAQYIFPQPEQPELGRIFIRKTQALADDAHHCLFGNAAVDPISAVEAVQQLRPRRLHVAPRFVAETDPALGLPTPPLSKAVLEHLDLEGGEKNTDHEVRAGEASSRDAKPLVRGYLRRPSKATTTVVAF